MLDDVYQKLRLEKVLFCFTLKEFFYNFLPRLTLHRVVQYNRQTFNGLHESDRC